MMQLVYRLTKNCRIIAENADLAIVKEIADQDAKKSLEWKDFSDVTTLYMVAFNGPSAMNRDEYEVSSYKKRV